MNQAAAPPPNDFATQGRLMHQLATELFPFHRSITGDGLRSTLEVLGKHLPLELTEVPSGTQVFDWTVPPEWRIRDAYIAATDGTRIVDYADSNLQVVNYSQPVRSQLTWDQLQPHIHTLPDQPDVIPYRTAFFRDEWGFCVNAAQYRQLRSGGPWQVVIDADFFDGSLTVAECVVKGKSDETVLLHCHTCHPSLANDNLSGIVVATFLAKQLQLRELRYSYRLVMVPATIGAITSLAITDPSQRQQVRHGLVLTLLGDGAPFTYKPSRSESATIDRLVPKVLSDDGIAHRVLRFAPTGYDERQYGSPGIDLPVGRLTRSVHGQFAQYHTSADNLDFIRPQHLAESLRVCLAIVEGLEANVYPINRNPCGEPQLGQRGIFRAFGQHDDRGRLQEAMMWILNLADGQHDLLSIAERSGLALTEVRRAASELVRHDLIETHDHAAPERFSAIVARHNEQTEAPYPRQPMAETPNDGWAPQD